MTSRFAILGAAAAVAERHARAVADVGGSLVATADPAGPPSWLAERFPSARHFDTVEALTTELTGALDKVVVCTPNDLHEAHVELSLRAGADVVCEKPVALDPGGVDRLAALETETGRVVHAVLQLRLHPEVQRMAAEAQSGRHGVELDYVLARGPEFLASWHGREDRSGGLIFEIGVHFLDFLLTIFGPADQVQVHERTAQRVTGELRLARADVRWRLSVDPEDVPPEKRGEAYPSHRVLAVDGHDYDLARGRGTVGLHTKLYEDILSGGGFGLADARPAVALADQVRRAVPAPSQAPR